MSVQPWLGTAMSRTDGTAAKPVESIAGRPALERELRLWSGVVLFAFVTMHLSTTRSASSASASWKRVQRPRLDLAVGARAPFCSTALSLCISCSPSSGWRDVVLRRMPGEEAVQFVLGLLIPYLLIDHIVGTRRAEPLRLWRGLFARCYGELWGDPAVEQMVLVIVTWVHGCIGIAQAARGHDAVMRWREAWFAFACLVPVISLAGFVSAAREVTARVESPSR